MRVFARYQSAEQHEGFVQGLISMCVCVCVCVCVCLCVCVCVCVNSFAVYINHE